MNVNVANPVNLTNPRSEKGRHHTRLSPTTHSANGFPLASEAQSKQSSDGLRRDDEPPTRRQRHRRQSSCAALGSGLGFFDGAVAPVVHHHAPRPELVVVAVRAAVRHAAAVTLARPRRVARSLTL